MNPDGSRDRCLEVRLVAVEQTDEGRIGWVEHRGVRWSVRLDLVPDAQPGDRLVVQAGVALARAEASGEVRR